MKKKNYALGDAFSEAASNAQQSKNSGSFWTGLFGAAQNVFSNVGKNNSHQNQETDPPVEKKSNTGLIIGIVAAAVVVGLIVYFTAIKK